MSRSSDDDREGAAGSGEVPAEPLTDTNIEPILEDEIAADAPPPRTTQAMGSQAPPSPTKLGTIRGTPVGIPPAASPPSPPPSPPLVAPPSTSPSVKIVSPRSTTVPPVQVKTITPGQPPLKTIPVGTPVPSKIVSPSAPTPPRTQSRAATPPPMPAATPPAPPIRRTRTDVAAPKPPATPLVPATLVTGQPETPTVIERALVSLTDANKARADRLARELEATAANDPAHAATLAYELGELCERRLDNEERALSAYRRSFELDPDLVPNRWALRRVLYRRALWPELERVIDVEVKRVTEDAERVELLFERALVSTRRKGGDEQARTALVGASQLAPHHQGVLFELERLIARSRDKARLVDVCERLAEAIDQPEDKIAYLLEVARGCAATDLKRAIRAFDMATQLAMGVSTALAVRVTREALRQADTHGTAADIASALDGFAQTLGAAVAEAASGERRSAAYARFRDLAALRRRQGQVLRGADTAAAWSAFQEALSLAPDDPLVLADLIELAAELGRYKELMVLAGSWRQAEADTARARMLSAWSADARVSPERRVQARVLLGALAPTAPGFILLTAAAECDALANIGQQHMELAAAYLGAARAAADGTWGGPGAPLQPDPAAAASFYLQAADTLAYYVGTPEASVQAVEALEKALEVVPDHPAVLEALIELDDVTDQPKRALARCRTLAEAAPKDRSILERALRVAVTHNVTEQVLELQRAILTLDPTDCWAAWRLDAMLAQHGREEERRAVLTGLAQHEVDPARKRTALVAAARHLDRAGDADAALALYQQLLPLCPADGFVRDAYSDLLRTHERWEQLAAERIETARAATDGQLVRRALREAAWVLEVCLGDSSRAADVYDEWLARLPDDRTALEGIARCRAALRDPQRESVARAAIAELDKTAEARWLYARSLERAGRHPQAIEEYRALLSHDEGGVAVLGAALALGDLASAGPGIAMRIEAAEAVATRTTDTALGAALHEQAGWMHLVGGAEAEARSRAKLAFETALAKQPERAGALLGSIVAAGGEGDRSALRSVLVALAPAMPTPSSRAALFLRAAAVAVATSEIERAADDVDAAVRAAPDDVHALVAITEGAPPRRPEGSDPFAAAEQMLARAELLARRVALADDPMSRSAFELDRADALELGGLEREAGQVLAEVLAREPDNRRAISAVRRIARRVGDAETLAQASYALSRLSRDRTVQLRLLREAAQFYDRPEAPQSHAVYARAIYARVIELEPAADEGDRLLDLARDSGEPAAIVNLLSDQLARLGANVPVDETRVVPLLFERATMLRVMGQLEPAGADLDALLAHVPNHIEALRMRAEIALDTGDRSGAVNLWTKYLAIETTSSRKVEVERMMRAALEEIDDVAPPPAPAPPAVPEPERPSGRFDSATDVRAYEDENGAWEMEFTDPDAPGAPPSIESVPGMRKPGRRTSNIIRRLTPPAGIEPMTPPTGISATQPTVDPSRSPTGQVETVDPEAFEANTVVGDVADPFGGATAQVEASDLLEEERRLAHAAAKLEQSSVVAAAAAPDMSLAPPRRAAMFAAPPVDLPIDLPVDRPVDPRSTTEQQAVVEPPRTGSMSIPGVTTVEDARVSRKHSTTAGPTIAEPRKKAVTAGPTFADRPARASAAHSVLAQKSIVTVAEKPIGRPDMIDPRARYMQPTLVPPALGHFDIPTPSGPVLDARQLRVPERPVELEGSAAVVMSYSMVLPSTSKETNEDSLHELERELGLAATDPANALALRLEAGRLAELRGETERARGHYDAALALDPAARPALRGLRRIARERSDVPTVLQLLDAELALASPRERDAYSRYRLALLLAVAEHDLARAAVGELLERAPDDPALLFVQLELSLADGRTAELAPLLERLAEGTAGPLRAALQAARGVLAARDGDTNTAGTWFTSAASSDPESLGLRLDSIRDAARGQWNPGEALLELAYRVEREDPTAAAAVAVRALSYSDSESGRETQGAAAQLAAGAAPRDPLVGRLTAETALLTEEPAQASHAFARWVRCKAVPAERAFAAARAAELDPARLGRLWAQVLELDPGDDYAAARLRAVHLAAGAKDQALELDLQTAKTAHRDVPLLRATTELIRERRIDEAIDVLESTREYRPTWVIAEALADAFAAAKKWADRARVLAELVAEPGLLASDVVRLRAAFAADRAARGASTSSEERDRHTNEALDAWGAVLGDDPRSLVAHAASISLAGRLEDRGTLVKVLARARAAERSPWGASSLSLRYARMLLAGNPRLAQTVARDAAAAGLDDPRTTLARVMAAATRGELGEAVTALEERATQCEMKSAGAQTHEPTMLRLRAAAIALDAGDLPRARQLLARVDKAIPGLVDDLLDVARMRAGEPPPTSPRPRSAGDGFARLIRDGDNAAGRGDHALALQYYQRAATLRPDDPFATMPFTRSAFKLRAHAPLGVFARERLRVAHERGDTLAKADAYELQARVDELRGDTAAMVASLEHAAQLDPSRLDLVHQVACEYAASGHHGKLFELRTAALVRLEGSDMQATLRDRVALLFDSATLATLDNRSDEIIAKLYHRVLELDRRNRLALFHLEAIVRKANALEPLAALEEHIAGTHEDPRIRATFLTRAGDTLADAGKRAEAVQRFARAVELVPSYLPALEAWHDTALAGELWTELAEAATRKAALGGTPAEVGSLHHLAAVALMDKARARDAATSSLRQALDAMPNNLDALLRLRILLEHTAQRELYAAHVRHRLDAETDRASKIELHRMLAEHCRYSGLRDDAIREYRAMLAINPADVRAHAAIADISTDHSDWRTVADAVIARIPLERDVQVLRTLHYRLGLLYAEHDVGEAIKAYQRALSFRPDDEQTLVRLTDLAISAGMWDIAVGTCDRLVSSERDPEVLATHLHRAAVIFFRGFNDRERAERMLRLAVDSAPASPDTVQLLVQFYQEIGDAPALWGQLDRIVDAMRARIDANPLDGAASRALSRAVYARGATSNARQIARTAAELAQVLGTAGEPEMRLLSEEPLGDPARLVGPGADEALLAGASEPHLRELLRRFAEPIAKHIGADVGAHGVGRKERLRAPHPVLLVAKTIATALGFKDVEVYVSARHPYAMAAEPTNPVSLVIGEAIAAGNPATVRFAAGAALKLAQLALSIPARLPPADLAAVAAASWKLATPDVTVAADAEIVQAHMHKLRKLVGAGALAEARPLALAVTQINAPALARDLKIVGLRAGLAASGSLVAALTVVAGAVGGNVQSVLSDPIGRELVTFALSDHRTPQ